LFQRCLAEAPEPWRLAPCPISVSERPFVSNRANLAPSGSASRKPAFSAGFSGPTTMDSAGVLPVGEAAGETRGRRFIAGRRGGARNRPNSVRCFGFWQPGSMFPLNTQSSAVFTD